MKPQVTTEHHTGKAKMFDSPFLESLSKTTLTSNVIVFGSVIGLMIYYALSAKQIPFYTFVGLFVFALFFWTFAEYILHRFLFHWLNESKIVKRFHFIVHGAHHLYPRDKERLLMPPIPGLLLASVLFSIFYVVFAIIGYADYTWGFFPGFFLGYLLYSFLHRAIHVIKPPKRFEYLWKHHTLHHYQYPEKAFGVSTLFWDRVFGTMPPK